MSVVHRLTLLISLVLALGSVPVISQGIDLTCFNGGLVGDCSSFVNTFCNSTRTVNVNVVNSASQCFEHPDGFRCDLNAWHAISTGGTIFSQQACEEALSTASSSCSVGGSGIAVGGSFVFTIKPNNGACGDDSAIPNE